jgi:DNA-binding MarR family transcriptional regulator
MTSIPTSDNAESDLWRQSHMGHWMGLALRKFDIRVLSLLARNDGIPLALSNLARRGQLGASHIQVTRHLAIEGSRLTELAQRANMTKQAMGKLVDECESWGLVARLADLRDARSRRIVFTPVGLAWLQAFRQAVVQAEAELRTAVGPDVAIVMALGLEAYAA